ncbi:MAG: 1-acyl-sn-glycerol-3-phosphate acyltransferase [Anaerolineaceae bacterium]|nr:1-acyl-sn-glycerol-3-phosphate acyltransferase [Anaerolineaceae bacterium]
MTKNNMSNKSAVFLKPVTWVVKMFFRILCKIDTTQLSKIPMQGPAIIMGNHINFLDSPIMYSNLFPRQMTGFAKVETWKNPFLGRLFTLWGFIPIRRGEADLKAFKTASQALNDNKFMTIAPEGTRSHDGKLQKGHPGIVLLAIRSGVPIIPIGINGIENFEKNLRRFKRTPFNIEVGIPFRLDTQGKALSREVREQITTEVMYQLAALLPPQNRGVYHDLSKASEDYIVFDSRDNSN